MVVRWQNPVLPSGGKERQNRGSDASNGSDESDPYKEETVRAGALTAQELNGLNRRREMRRIILLVGVMIALLVQGLAFAGGQVRWQKDGVVIAWGTADPGWQGVIMVPDGKGGAIISWADTRGSNGSVYAQRVDSTGNCLWDSGGVCLRSDTWYPDQMNAVSDGRGGAIVVWDDYPGSGTPGQIRAQRVDSSGTVRWGPQGIVVTYNWDSWYYFPSIVTDGENGAIIAWAGRILPYPPDTGYTELCAQKVDSTGSLKWPEAVLIDSPDVEALFPQLASDGLGGGIVSWADGYGLVDDNYVARIDGEGKILWNFPLCTAEGRQTSGSIVSDGEGGGILTWSDGRDSKWDIYTQKVNNNGQTMWHTNGVPICLVESTQAVANCINDGSSGEVIVWLDNRYGDWDIYAQRIDGNGELQWDSAGICVCDEGELEELPKVVTDGKGEAIIAWRDHRAGWDIYSQRIDSKGKVRWDSGGLGVCTYPTRIDNLAMTSDGNIGAIIAWWDDRRPPDCPYGSIFAQRVVDTDTDWVDPHFGGGRLPTRFVLGQNWPNPFNANTAISYQLSAVSGQQLAVSLKVYNILGEEVVTLVDKPQKGGHYQVVWDGKNKGGTDVSSGIYFYQLKVGGFAQTRKMLLIR